MNRQQILQLISLGIILGPQEAASRTKMLMVEARELSIEANIGYLL